MLKYLGAWKFRGHGTFHYELLLVEILGTHLKGPIKKVEFRVGNPSLQNRKADVFGSLGCRGPSSGTSGRIFGRSVEGASVRLVGCWEGNWPVKMLV